MDTGIGGGVVREVRGSFNGELARAPFAREAPAGQAGATWVPCLPLVLAFAAGALGCGVSKEAPSRPASGGVLVAHYPVTGAAATQQMGEDCGRAACAAGGVCLKALSPLPGQGHVCTIRGCLSDDSCPESWTCRAVRVGPGPGPGPDERYCLPPPDFVPKPVTVRQRTARAAFVPPTGAVLLPAAIDAGVSAGGAP